VLKIRDRGLARTHNTAKKDFKLSKCRCIPGTDKDGREQALVVSPPLWLEAPLVILRNVTQGFIKKSKLSERFPISLNITLK